ncbi:Ig-like domain-containing protein, partial [Blastococcus deserti]
PTAGGAAVGAAVAYDSTTRIATLDPSAELAANTQYTATLSSGITDAAGNPLAPVSWSFTTAAATSSGPVVTNRSPAPDARSVVVGTNVTATFNTAVQNVNTSTFTLANAATGQSVAAVVSFNSTSLVATLNPDVNLAPDTRYRATLTTGITDTAGNALAANESWEFVTGPAPRVTGRSPAVNATGVSRTANVTATFSEPVQNVSTTTFTLTPAAGGAAVTAQVTRSGTTNTWILDPSAELAANTQYTATLASGITDAAGNPLAPVSWSFTTAAATSSGPVVTNRSPAPDARSVVVGTNVTATFNTAVQNVNTSTFTLANAATGQSVAAVVSFNSTSLVATLNPDVNLAPDTRYRATLTTGITDTAGNALAANESWEFVTGPAPRVTGRSPAVNATGVSRTANVTATFSEPVQNVSTTTFTLTPAAGGAAVTAQVTRSGTTNTWILNPDESLAGNTKYTATLASGITDAAGNPLAPVSWSFTTGP